MPNTTHYTANLNSEALPVSASPTLKRTWLTPHFECVSMEDAASATSTPLIDDLAGYS